MTEQGGVSDAEGAIGSQAPLLKKIPLWPHQILAIQRMLHYLSDFGEGLTKGSALVQMPTGSGKTGVIACLARCINGIDNVLVLAPRIAIRDQLWREVSGRFFSRLGVAHSDSDIPKNTIRLVGGVEVLQSNPIENTVIVSTVQKLHSIERHDPGTFEFLKQHVSLIMFDEGHYEPAPSWSRVVRLLEAPKVIFTATPYRNDLKAFDVDTSYVSSYSYDEAVEDGYLRSVKITELKGDPGVERFVDDVLTFYSTNYESKPNNTARVIIRCDRDETIRQIATSLEQRGCEYVAIHENFSDSNGDPHERRTVPSPDAMDARFWIHQFKLLEGIDDPRFQILALFRPLTTARELVQQIGRIIRNPGMEKNAVAHVLDHSSGAQAELWDGFLRYDREIRKQGDQGLTSALGVGQVESFLRAQPSLAYTDGRFRFPLDLDNFYPPDDLRLQLRTNLFRKGHQFDLEAFSSRVKEEHERLDRRVARHSVGEDTWVLIYVDASNSRLLRTATFLNITLGATVIHDQGGFLSFYDSMGMSPRSIPGAGLQDVPDKRSLKRLFRDHQGTYLKEVSLANANIGSTAIRSRSLRAAKIRETVSFLDDHAQICTTAFGYSVDDFRRPMDQVLRYVGFANGRISDKTKQPVSLDEYLDWLDRLVHYLKRRVSTLDTFSRYAQDATTPDNPTPRHILLDLFEVESRYTTLGSDSMTGGQQIEIQDIAAEVADGTFDVTANGQVCTVNIDFDEAYGRYLLESVQLNRLYEPIDQVDRRGIIDYLNQEQSFRIVPASTGIVYVNGGFYKPTYKIGKDFDPGHFEVSKILFPCKVLDSVSAEKTVRIVNGATEWSPAALFGIIDRLGSGAGLKKYFGSPDIVVCDDMQTEVADFILADTKKQRVVFIHAKASQTKRLYSASALQEVCAQASKNISYIGMYSEQQPKNLNRWAGPWKRDGKEIESRIRKGQGAPHEIWEKIQGIIRNPLSEREVWLLLGQTLSVKEFEACLSQIEPEAEAVQSAFLLHSTLTTAGMANAKLRVFCSP